MLGSFAVGKTSLVQRYVNSIFSTKYLTTIGVKIDQKRISIDNQEVSLILWDIHGDDDFQKIPMSYLKGASGFFLVMDGTRIQSLEVMLEIKKLSDQSIGDDIPFLILVNKVDLEDEWAFTPEHEEIIKSINGDFIYTSAKTGQGVEDAFLHLTKVMLS